MIATCIVGQSSTYSTPIGCDDQAAADSIQTDFVVVGSLMSAFS